MVTRMATDEQMHVGSYVERKDDFALDENGNPQWVFHSFESIPNPTKSANPDSMACARYSQSGFGSCAQCGHYIVDHYFIKNIKTGEIVPVGSECIKAVLGANKQKAMISAVKRVTNQFNNLVKLKYLKQDYEAWFKDHLDTLATVIGIYDDAWRLQEVSTEIIVMTDRRYDWEVAHDWPVNVYPELKKIKLSENKHDLSKAKYDPYHRVVVGQEILNNIRVAYERNHKNISYIFEKIEFFNTEKQYSGGLRYDVYDNMCALNNHPEYDGKEAEIKIPVFKKINFRSHPLTEEEMSERSMLVQEALKRFENKE